MDIRTAVDEATSGATQIASWYRVVEAIDTEGVYATTQETRNHGWLVVALAVAVEPATATVTEIAIGRATQWP